MRFSKRYILRLGTALAVSLGAGRAHALAGAGAETRKSEAVHRLLGVFSRPESAAIVGRRYLERYPMEADPVRLLAAIEGRLRRAAGPPSLPPLDRIGKAQLDRHIAAAVARDFEDGRMAEVEGWLLAETEARLCALAALEHHDRTGRLIG